MITATVNAEGYRRAMAGLSDAFMATGRVNDSMMIVKNRSRKLCETVIKLTPPKNKGKGVGAVKRDLIGKRQIFVFADQFLENSFVREDGNVHLFASRNGYRNYATPKNFKPDASESDLNAFHRSRLTRKGKIRKGHWRPRGKDIEWSFMIARKRTVLRYVKTKTRAVGRMKGSFGKAFLALGGQLNAWLTGHATGNRRAILRDDLKKPNRPTFTFGSTARGVSRIDHFLQKAMIKQMNAMKRETKLVLSGYSRDIKNKMRPRKHAKPVAASA